MLHIHLNDPYALGGQFFLWEMATAIAGYRLGVHPFDQPNVEAAKQRTQEAVNVYSHTGSLTEETPAATYDDMRLYGSLVADSPEEALQAFLAQGQPGDYVTMQAYLPPPITLPVTEQQTSELTKAMQETSEIHASLLSMCARMRDKYHLAATFGYGPRYLHSTGQLHKGDAGRGLFIQLTADALQDVPIPAETGEITPALSFGTLEAAQALGDRQALVEAGRRLIRFHLGAQVVERLHQLNQALV
jgi:glucose-6-phosphate isomerase